MRIAPKTSNEESRLEALLRYKVLDTESEGPYDDLVSLASHICQKPIALISLVDNHRQWFKARVGLDAQETSRDLAFCAHAIHQTDVMEVSNTLEDERFFDNPLVQEEPSIRFYAGAPLITHDGFALGTLCVIDREPGKLSPEQKDALKVLSRQVISQLELRLSNAELQDLNREKEAFIRLLSHEIRSSFAGVIGFSQLLKKRITKLDKEAVIDSATKILRCAEQGGKLLDSLLEWSRLQGTQVQLSETAFNAGSVCQETIEYLFELADAKDITITLDCAKNFELHFDKTLFRSVIQNLLHNAIKFSHLGGEVLVKLSETQNEIQLVVQDHGVGMTEKVADTLFDREFKTTPGTRGESGTGIGTQLIRDFVEHYKGRIHIDSKPNQGTTITVSLPK